MTRIFEFSGLERPSFPDATEVFLAGISAGAFGVMAYYAISFPTARIAFLGFPLLRWRLGGWFHRGTSCPDINPHEIPSGRISDWRAVAAWTGSTL